MDRASWEAGFMAAWDRTGEGYNGEWPDEGVTWDDAKHAGADCMRVVADEMQRRGEFA